MNIAKGIRLSVAMMVFAPGFASAWDGTGHMQIADIAWSRLTPSARIKIGEILFAGDPAFRPSSPTDMISVRQKFREAATWCDVIKGKASPQYDTLIEGLNAQSSGVKPPAGKHLGITSEEVRCKTWHYFDTPIPSTGDPARPSNASVALKGAMSSFSQLLASNDKQTACFCLYWIEHVTGDVHQPLHCASYFGSSHQNGGDHGGNSYLVLVPYKKNAAKFSKVKLHGYWDAGIDHALAADGLADPEAATTAWIKKASLRPTPSQLNDVNVDHWIASGANLAKTKAYAIAEGAQVKPAYAKAQADLCRKLAVLAGYRLAKVLNDRLQ